MIFNIIERYLNNILIIYIFTHLIEYMYKFKHICLYIYILSISNYALLSIEVKA